MQIRKRVLLPTIFFFLGLFLPAVLPAQVITDSLSFARNGICSCVLGDKVFFAGSSNGTDTVDVYDNTTGAWSVVRMQTRKSYPLCRVVNNKAYFIGTMALYNDPDSARTMDYYDNSTGNWATDTIPAFLPVPLLDFDVEVYNQKLVFLNETPNPQLWPAYLFTLNTQTHAWTADTIADSLISSARIAIHNDEVMWISKSSNPWQHLVHYDLNSGVITLDSFPGFVNYPDVYSAGNKTFIMGGVMLINFQNSHLFMVYDHLTDTFAQHTYVLGYPAIIRYGNHVFFGGQSYYSGNYTSNSPLGVIYNLANDQMTTVIMSKPRSFYGLTASCGKFVLAGGYSYNQNFSITYQDTIDFFDTLTYVRSTGEMLLQRSDLRAETVGQELLFAAGRTNSNTFTDLVEIYTCLNVGEEEEKEANSTVVIFPNPAQDIITIQQETGGGTFAVMDMLGRSLLGGTLTGNTSKIRLDALPPGVYFLHLYFENDNSITKRFLINR